MACIVRKHLDNMVSLEKKDAHNRYLWLKINGLDKPLYVASCYIPHRESKFYAQENIMVDDAFEDLSMDICHYRSQGYVLVMGDFNARIGDMQPQSACFDETDDNECLEIPDGWLRQSADHMTNTQGKLMKYMLNGLHMLVLNGMACFKRCGEFTCYASSGGSSVVDLAIAHVDSMHIIDDFQLGEKRPESDHVPLYVQLKMWMTAPLTAPQYHALGYRLKEEKIEPYRQRVETLLKDVTPSDWASLKSILHQAAGEVFGPKSALKRGVRGLPCNRWYDEECRTMRAAAKRATGGDKATAEKTYHGLLRKKKRLYMQNKEVKDAELFKRSPKQAWQQSKGRKSETYGEFSTAEMLHYAQNLYSLEGGAQRGEPPCGSPPHFSLDEVEIGIKKLANGKACDSDGLSAELLKWALEPLLPPVAYIVNEAMSKGFPLDWQRNWIKAIHKGGDKNALTNYRTIMISSLFAKLVSTLLEKRISKWAEENDKRARGQAGFRAQHSTTDHLITLRVLFDEARRTGNTLYCCFVDFKKAFDTIPRGGLWERMRKIGVPEHLQAGVGKLYEQVRCKLRTCAELVGDFESNIGVKQGCPLSPTLFGLFIDALEEYLAGLADSVDGPMLGGYVVLLLLYADDVVLMAYEEKGLHLLLQRLAAFCEDSGLEVNVAKTKILLVKTFQPKHIPSFLFKGKQIENVSSFKYLGIDVPSDHKWGKAVERRLEAATGHYYAFENMCTQQEISSWRVRCTLFDALVVQTVLYGVEVWGGSIPPSTWNDIEKLQKQSLRRFLGVRRTTPYATMLLETGCRPIEFHAMIRVIDYVWKISGWKCSRLPKAAKEVSIKIQKNHKSKILSSGWMLDIQTWFKRWGVDNFLNSKVKKNEEFSAALITNMWTKWKMAEKKSKLDYYCSQVNPGGEEKYVKGGAAQGYITAAISIHTRGNIARMRLRSHSLEIEMGAWAQIDRCNRLCKVCNEGKIEDEWHVIIECSQYRRIRSTFEAYLQEKTSLAAIFEDTPPRILGSLIAKILRHRDELLSKTTGV